MRSIVRGSGFVAVIGSLCLLALVLGPQPAGARVPGNVDWPTDYTFNNPLVVMSTTAGSLEDMKEDTEVYFWVLEGSESKGVSLEDFANGTGDFSASEQPDYTAKMHQRGQSTLTAAKPQFGVEITDSNSSDNFLNMNYGGDHWIFNDAGTYDYTMLRNMLAFDMQRTLGGDTGSGAWAPRGKYFELFAVTGRDSSSVKDVPTLDQITNGYSGVYLNLEEIRPDANRVNINTEYTAPNVDSALGGLIVQVNTPSDDSKLVLAGGNTAVGSTSNEVVVQWPKLDKLSSSDQTAINNWYYPQNGFNPSYPDGYNSNFSGWAYMFTNNPGYLKSQGVINESMITDAAYESMMEEYTDLQSFAEYLLLNEVAKDPDGYHRSTFMYREVDVLSADGTTVTPGKMYAGPLWDKNKSYANTHPTYANFSDHENWSFDIAGQTPWWWQSFLGDSNFLTKVKDVWDSGSASGGAFDIKRITSFLTGQQDSLNSTGSYKRDYQLFYLGQTAPNHQDTCDTTHLISWLKERLDWMKDNMSTLTGSN